MEQYSVIGNQAAMEVFGSGESKSLAFAFNQAKIPVPKQGMNSVLSYAARQMAAGARMEEEAASYKNAEALEKDLEESDGTETHYGDNQRFSFRVTDEDEKAFLENQDTITTYKTMQLVDGKLYPPMAAVVAGNMEDYSVLGEWEKATEHPELIKNGNKFTLNKGRGKGSLDAAYNPYMHSSNLMINDQFSGAYNRPELVTVECEVPVSEADSGYHAEFAKDSVGWHSWHTGTVAGQLRNQKGIERQVFLSRWIKPVRILSDSEVAQHYKELLDGTDIQVPDNVVSPSLLKALKEAGVPIKESGRVTGDGQKRYSFKAGLKAEKDYSYEALVSKPDMKITQMKDISEDEIKKYQDSKPSYGVVFRKEIAESREKGIKVQYDGDKLIGVYIYVPDAGHDIMIGSQSYEHIRNDIKTKEGVQVFKNLPNILRNSIVVNEINGRTEYKKSKPEKINKRRESNYGYVLLGMAETDKAYIPVRFKVENRTWKVLDYDILTGINKKMVMKKGRGLAAPRVTDESDSGTSFTKSISDILQLVKNVPTISNVLSLDVAEKLGYTRGHDEILGDSLRYSFKADDTAGTEQQAMEDVRDDAELYAQLHSDEDSRAALMMLNQLHRLTTRGGADAIIQRGAFEQRLSEIVQKIQEQTGTKYGANKLRNKLRKIYTAMEQSDYRAGEVLQYTRDLMRDVLDAARGCWWSRTKTKTQRSIKASLCRREESVYSASVPMGSQGFSSMGGCLAKSARSPRYSFSMAAWNTYSSNQESEQM